MAESGTVQQLIRNAGVVDEALRRAAAAAPREYLRAGLSMPVWRGGRLVWVETEELAACDGDGHPAGHGHDGVNGSRAV